MSAGTPHASPAPHTREPHPAPRVRPAGPHRPGVRPEVARGLLGKVLVVDDDHEVREALRDVLDDAGYAVTTAANGAEALCQLERSSAPDVIILDLTMPVMDGYEFLSRRERDPALRAIPVVVVSAVVESQVLGGNGVQMLRKPIDLDTLCAVIGGRRA